MDSLVFLEELSNNLIEIPLFKKASSLILFSRIEGLNLIDEKTSLDAKKVILVPRFLVCPIFFNGLIDFPFSNLISYSFPSLKILNSSFSDRAFTTETPTPCKPPDTL